MIKQHPIFKDYKISSNGDVFGKNGKLMAKPISQGYERLTICYKGERLNKFVHVLVMETFVGKKPKGLVINHKDHNKQNNCIENLEYCTQSKNIKKVFINKIRNLKGENNNNASLNKKKVKEIRGKYIPRVYSIRKLAKEYGVSSSCIQNIVNNKNWNYEL